MKPHAIPWFCPEAIAEREATARMMADPSVARAVLHATSLDLYASMDEREVAGWFLCTRLDAMIAECEWNGAPSGDGLARLTAEQGDDGDTFTVDDLRKVGAE